MILVTGGAGFIGSNLVNRLVNEGFKVKVADNFSSGMLENVRGIEFTSNIRHLPLGIDMIFHLGMPSSSPMYKKHNMLVGETVNDMICLLNYAVKHKVRKIVYASSSSLYNGNDVPYHERMPIHVSDYYTECRYMIERLAQLYSKLYGLQTVGLRLFSVYGEGEDHKKQYANMVSQFLWKLKKSESMTIYGNGSQTRDFIYVGDVVDAFLKAKEYDGSAIFNVGTGVSYSFNQVWSMISKVLLCDIKPEYVENPISTYVQDTLADTYYAMTVLGFKSKMDLRDGVEKLAWNI